METYLKNKESTWYSMPENVVGVLIDPTTGTTSSSKKQKIMYYIKGTEPKIDQYKTIPYIIE